MKICENCTACQTRVGWVGLIVSLVVAGFTVFIGIMNNSKALLAVSLCLGIDITSALTVILGLRLANKSINLKHPYGYGKIEFIVVTGLAVLLIISALVLFGTSMKSIYFHEKGPDQWLTLLAALLLTGVNWLKHKYTKCVGLHFNSPAIINMAEHARVDTFSSFAVVIGVLFAKAGLHFVDPLIAIFEIGHILKVSVNMLMGSIRSLMDISIPQESIESMQEAVQQVKGVEDIGYFHARHIGRDIWVELSISVDPEISIFEGKKIAENVRNYLFRKKDHIGNIQVQFFSHTVQGMKTA